MIAVTLLLLAAILQIAAAVVAFRSVTLTRHRLAWLSIAGGLLIVAVRESLIPLFDILVRDGPNPYDIGASLLPVLASALLLLALLVIAPRARSRPLVPSDHIERERLLATLMGNLPGMAYRCRNDPNWTMEFVSEGCKALTGYEPDDLIDNRKTSFGVMIHPDDKVPVWNEVQRAIKERKPFRLTYRIHDAHGREKWVWEQGVGIFSESDEFLALEGFITDITERKQAEQDLSRQREEYHTVFQSVPAMIWYKDRENRILRANQAASDSIGRPVSEIEGRSTAELYPQDAERYHADDLEVIRSGRPKLGIIEPYQVSSGEKRWIRTDKIPYRDHRGEIQGVIVFAQDITMQKRAEEAVRENEERFRNAFDHAPIGMAMVDLSGRFLRVNRRFCDMVGYSEEEMRKLDFQSITHPADLAGGQVALQSFTEGDISYLQTEKRYVHRNRHHVWAELSVSVIRDAAGKPLHFVTQVHDITDRKHADELRKAKEAAEAANRAKTEFLAKMSHEIRTPIVAILGAAELMTSRDGNGEPGRADMILRNGRHLLSLIDDLLDLARLEKGRYLIQIADASLKEIIADLRAAVAPWHRNARVEFRVIFETDLPVNIRTDATRLKQAVINLISNALKFTTQGRVELRIKVVAEGSGMQLIVTVTDTGCGIPREALESIFESFTQLDRNGTGLPQGAGLGLSIARTIVERLGGTLNVVSEEDRGSSFTIRVPVGPTAEAENEDVASVIPAGSFLVPHWTTRMFSEPPIGRKLAGSLLLADDAADSRDLFAHALTDAGAEVTSVADGKEAVAAASCNTFDLILLDIRMPNLSGLEAVAELRGKRCLCPIIALTASTSAADRERILNAGFDDLWYKPISLSDLVDRVAPYLRSASRSLSPVESDAASDMERAVDPTLARRLSMAAEEFIQTLPQKINVLESRLRVSDMLQVRESLHQLVGTAGIHGCMELSHLASRLLSALRRGQVEIVVEGVSEMRRMAQRLGVSGSSRHSTGEQAILRE